MRKLGVLQIPASDGKLDFGSRFPSHLGYAAVPSPKSLLLSCSLSLLLRRELEVASGSGLPKFFRSRGGP